MLGKMGAAADEALEARHLRGGVAADALPTESGSQYSMLWNPPLLVGNLSACARASVPKLHTVCLFYPYWLFFHPNYSNLGYLRQTVCSFGKPRSAGRPESVRAARSTRVHPLQSTWAVRPRQMAILRRDARDGNHVGTVAPAVVVAGGDDGKKPHPPRQLVDLGVQLQQERGAIVDSSAELPRVRLRVGGVSPHKDG